MPAITIYVSNLTLTKIKHIMYKPITKSEVSLNTQVIYHPIIGTDKLCKLTQITSEVWLIGNDPCVKVKDVSGGVFLEAIELKSEYDRRKAKKRRR